MVKTRKDFTSDEDYQHYLYVRKEWKKNKCKEFSWESNVEESKNNLKRLLDYYEDSEIPLRDCLECYIERLKLREGHRKYYNLGKYE